MSEKTISTTTGYPTRRSRNGCQECRRRHRRCDEGKPACSYCLSAGIACAYARKLSWGGRPFKKSRFGACMSATNGVVKVPSEIPHPEPGVRKSGSHGQTDGMHFVYSSRQGASTTYRRQMETEPLSLVTAIGSNVSSSEDETCQMQEESNSELDQLFPNGSEAEPEGFPAPMTSTREWSCPETSVLGCTGILNLDSPSLSLTSAHQKSLFDFFQHEVCLSFSCHQGIRQDLCSALVPMAYDHPHLLTAMLCAAASRRLTIGLHQNPEEITHMRSRAIQMLSHDINTSGDTNHVVALATSLVLCLAEIASADGGGGNWGVYLSGASALMKCLCQSPSQAGFSINFVKRLYTSIKVVSVGCGLQVGQLYTEEETANTIPADYIDDFKGFSKALVPILEQLHEMAKKRISGSKEMVGRGPDELQDQVCSTEGAYARLIEKVEDMLMTRKPRFRPEASAFLSLATKTDLWLLDEAYHFMVLLQLHDNAVKDGFTPHFSLGECVERIISCISGMAMASKPSPAAASLPPLFTAGCAATTESEQIQIMGLLCRLQAGFGMGNVMLTKQYLEARWKRSKIGEAYAEGSDAERSNLPTQDTIMLNFLPY